MLTLGWRDAAAAAAAAGCCYPFPTRAGWGGGVSDTGLYFFPCLLKSVVCHMENNGRVLPRLSFSLVVSEPHRSWHVLCLLSCLT